MSEKIRMERPKRSITIRALLRKPTEAFHWVRSGEAVVVIRNSRPVALLCPLPEEWFGPQPARPRATPATIEDPDDEPDGELGADLGEFAQQILLLALDGPVTTDSVATSLQQPVPKIGAQLGFLEMDGLLVRVLGRYELSRLGLDVTHALKSRRASDDAKGA